MLRPVGHQPDWRSVEVRRHSEGWCTMALTGHAAALADQAGIADLAVSLTHEGDVAAAVVVALWTTPLGGWIGAGVERTPDGRDDPHHPGRARPSPGRRGDRSATMSICTRRG